MNMLKRIFLNNAQIKIFSLILGYCFWHAIGQNQPTKIWLSAPVCFYNLNENVDISCKDSIKVQLYAKRADLASIEQENFAFHIDATEIEGGPQILNLKEKQLLLPDSIKMVRCSPTNIAIKKIYKSPPAQNQSISEKDLQLG